MPASSSRGTSYQDQARASKDTAAATAEAFRPKRSASAPSMRKLSGAGARKARSTSNAKPIPITPSP